MAISRSDSPHYHACGATIKRRVEKSTRVKFRVINRELKSPPTARALLLFVAGVGMNYRVVCWCLIFNVPEKLMYVADSGRESKTSRGSREQGWCQRPLRKEGKRFCDLRLRQRTRQGYLRRHCCCSRQQPFIARLVANVA